MKIPITGSTPGVGKQYDSGYAGQRHEVWADGRNQKTRSELKNKGLKAAKVDLASQDGYFACFSSRPSIDLAFLNAGTSGYTDMPTLDSALVSRVIRESVESMAFSIAGILHLLRKGIRSDFAGVGSSSAYLPFARAEAYGASKAAEKYLIKTPAITLLPQNFDMNRICPGFAQTPLTDRNDFPMPFLIDTAQASKYIRHGITQRSTEIHCPWRLTQLVKVFFIFPGSLYHVLAKGMTG